MDDCRTALARALVKANEACELDDRSDYESAIMRYRETVDMLDVDVFRELQPQQKQVVQGLKLEYTERADFVTNVLQLQDPLLDFIPRGSMPEPPPNSIYHRPYWLMRVLVRTMVTGGYFTHRLYVPRSLWLQQGAKLTGVTAKYLTCDTIHMYLLKLEKENIRDLSNWKALEAELEDFCGVLDKMQNSLATKLAFVPELKTEPAPGTATTISAMKDLGHLISKKFNQAQHNLLKEKIPDDSNYIELLINVLQKAQFLEEWLSFFETSHDDCEGILAKLKRISDFFYSVVCAFVIRDFHALIDRHMKKMRQNFFTVRTQANYKSV
eukprot:Colp12_sorted_trinity150504_noHs@6505